MGTFRTAGGRAGGAAVVGNIRGGGLAGEMVPGGAGWPEREEGKSLVVCFSCVFVPVEV